MTPDDIMARAAAAGLHIGAGIAAAMARRGDEPAGHEVELRPGWTIAPGRRHAYLWSQASDEVYLCPKA
jgi:hypothetical protein